MERRTVDFVERSESDLRERMGQWQAEGWAVLSLSGPIRLADGTIHRKAELSRAEDRQPAGPAYDDARIAMIERGQTTEEQLLEWFKHPESRNVAIDGRMNLSWSFPSRIAKQPGPSGALVVNLAPDGKVESYSARQVQPSRTSNPKIRPGYDDQDIARISRTATTESRLLEWFGAPATREAKADGRTFLSWHFVADSSQPSPRSGVLNVSLASDGKVDTYSAHRTQD